MRQCPVTQYTLKYKLKFVLISSYYALIEALISQRDISKGMALLDFAAQLRISTKMTNN
jgi:hypothetical protein